MTELEKIPNLGSPSPNMTLLFGFSRLGALSVIFSKKQKKVFKYGQFQYHFSFSQGMRYKEKDRHSQIRALSSNMVIEDNANCVVF